MRNTCPVAISDMNTVVMAPPMLVFDGDCGFCTRSARWLVDHTRPHAAVVPWQAIPLERWGLSESRCRAAVQFVTETGRVVEGAPAIAGLLSTSRAPWPVAAKIMMAPGVAAIAARVYTQIAVHRDRLPGATDQCRPIVDNSQHEG